MSWPKEPFLNLRQTATPKGTPSSGGALLYIKSDGKLYAKNASGVEALVADSATAYLAKANNLSDLASVPTARSNLGLGDAATQNVSAIVPPGVVHPYAGSSAPSGFLLCDGTAVSRTTYAALFAVLSTTYGTGDGSTTFNLPDLRGRVAVGVGTATGAAGATAHTLGQVGGEETHTLTTPEIPSHTHPPTVSGTAAVAATGSSATASGSAFFTASGTVGNLTIANTGGGGAHNNMQPYVGLNYIIKT